MLNALHPVSDALACEAYTCGHLTRSSSTSVKRALFLHLAEEHLGSVARRNEAPATMVALALMREGATCAEVAAADSPQGDALVAQAAREIAPRCEDLSPQVLAVLDLVTEGLSYPMIADRLGIARETVRSHVRRAMRATGEHSAIEAAVSLATQGLI